MTVHLPSRNKDVVFRVAFNGKHWELFATMEKVLLYVTAHLSESEAWNRMLDIIESMLPFESKTA